MEHNKSLQERIKDCLDKKSDDSIAKEAQECLRQLLKKYNNSQKTKKKSQWQTW